MTPPISGAAPEDIDQRLDSALLHAGDAPGALQRRPRRGGALLGIGLLVIVLSLVLALFGPSLAPFDPSAASADISQPPPDLVALPALLLGSLTGSHAVAPHWMGTDQSGFDVFSRIIAAPRTDMTIALSAAIISCVIGTLLGLLAGSRKSLATETMMRVSDLLQAFPVFITAMMLVAMAGRSPVNIVIALTLVYTPIFIRLTRAEVMSQMPRTYVEAARAAGNTPLRIALTHVLPNSLMPSIVQSSATVGFAIILTAGLSFVGAGVRPPTPEWGLMISQGAPQMILGQWWCSIFPGLAMSIVVFGYAVVGHSFEARFR
jgi:peptide/nickel transport system permease protein